MRLPRQGVFLGVVGLKRLADGPAGRDSRTPYPISSLAARASALLAPRSQRLNELLLRHLRAPRNVGFLGACVQLLLRQVLEPVRTCSGVVGRRARSGVSDLRRALTNLRCLRKSSSQAGSQLRHSRQRGEHSQHEKVSQLVGASLRFEASMSLLEITSCTPQFSQQRLVCRQPCNGAPPAKTAACTLASRVAVLNCRQKPVAEFLVLCKLKCERAGTHSVCL
jgi:hypothetical protein